MDNYTKKKLLGDAVLIHILEVLTTYPKSVQQISKDSNISLSTIYRKIRLLEKYNLTTPSGKIENGVKYRQYQKTQ